MLKHKHHRYKYQNTILLVLSLLVLFYFVESPFVVNTVKKIGEWGYFGAFVTGMFFVSTFTVAPAGLVLVKLVDYYHPLEIAFVAGLGSLLGDFVIFRFMKDSVFEELTPLYNKYAKKHLRVIFHTKYFAWLAPVLGAIIIASPFPDEIGITLVGISKMKTWEFLLLAAVLDFLGIFLIVSLATSF
ncbi:MAG TPA: hypothetical protein VD998_00005 [Verrucomicrobiae bacterium]|nr:hypothetical protein [Verrucomicrobiae bacterium]